MFTAKTYFFAPTLEEGYAMLQRNKANAIVAGCGWLRMGRKRIWTAIDLTKLGLDTITETQEEIRIGAMATLRDLETSPILRAAFDGVLCESVRSIVGVQFRNMATVGASVFMRAGYSDLLTALLALDCTVSLYAGGELPLAEFIDMPYTRDILKEIVLKKDGRRAAYLSLRNTATDFPTLAVCVSKAGDVWAVSVGARPARARLAVKSAALLAAGDLDGGSAAAAQELCYKTNVRGSADYRRGAARALVRRAAQKLLEGEKEA